MPNGEEPEWYEVEESEEFLARVEELFGSIEYWDAMKWAEDWAFERDPKSGQYIADDDAWAMVFRHNPPVVVFYRIDEKRGVVIPLTAYYNWT